MSTTPPAGDASVNPPNASLLRRFGAFVIDWVLSALITFNLLPFDLVLEEGRRPPMFLGAPTSSWAALGVFFVLNVALVSLAGSTVGHRLLGLQVWQVRPGPFPLQVVLRSALACLVLPAVFSGRDGRGLHDLGAGTRIVRVGAGAARADRASRA